MTSPLPAQSFFHLSPSLIMYLTHTSLLGDLQAIFHGRSPFLSEMRHDLLITAKVCLNLGTNVEAVDSSGSTPMTSAVVHLKRAHLRQ